MGEWRASGDGAENGAAGPEPPDGVPGNNQLSAWLMASGAASGQRPPVSAAVRVCVGALILNPLGEVFVQRRAPTAAVWPGAWDIVGGHMEPGESTADALAREVREETGWAVVRIGPLVAEWEWEHGAIVRREYDYFVDVLGDLSAPTLNPHEHDAWMWIGAESLDRLLEGANGDPRLRQLVARALSMSARRTEQGS